MSFPKTQVLTSANVITGKFLETKNDVTKLFNLSRTNAKLQKENVELLQRNPISFLQIDKRIVKINDTLFHQQYDYIPATVLNSTFDKRNNYFTLNVGSLHGAERGMGVFSDAGIVGIVHSVSEHFSIVKSVLTKDINIDVMVEGTEAFGLLKWDGTHARFGKISGISNDMKIKKWQKVITRGGSGIFPRGIPVGKISKIIPIEGQPLWDVKVLFFEDYRKTQQVYVIKNFLKIEQEKIEASIPEDEEE